MITALLMLPAWLVMINTVTVIYYYKYNITIRISTNKKGLTEEKTVPTVLFIECTLRDCSWVFRTAAQKYSHL
jgi:hypothetical protein